MATPLIGITTSELRAAGEHANRPESEPPMRELALGLAYPQAIVRAGGVPVVIPPFPTDACIRATLHGALVRGYDVTLVGDAHTTEDLSEWGAPPPDQVIAHTNLYWQYQAAPGRTAGVVEARDVTFG